MLIICHPLPFSLTPFHATTLPLLIGFFKIDGECAKCPENPYLLLAAIICGFFAIGVAFYVLHTKDINVAILSIGVDYFQIVSLFSRARIAWPRAIKDLFRLFSFVPFEEAQQHLHHGVLGLGGVRHY